MVALAPNGRKGDTRVINNGRMANTRVINSGRKDG